MLKSLSVALVEPSYEVNVGHVARLVRNFGAKELVLVNPSVNLERSRKFAAHGADVLDKVVVCKNIEEIDNKFDVVIGSTAIRARKLSNVARETIKLHDVTKVLEATVGNSKKICLLLGRDTTGLTNEELEKCDFVVTISTPSKYQTLNIAHALAILLHEFSKVKTGQRVNKDMSSRKDRQRLITQAIRLAEVSGLPEHRIPTIRKSIWKILGRSQPKKKEVFLLTGLFRKASRAIERAKKSHETFSNR